jgi:hypothetical protein
LAARVEFVNPHHLSDKEPAAKAAALRIRFSNLECHREDGEGGHWSDPPLIIAVGFGSSPFLLNNLHFFHRLSVAVIR